MAALTLETALRDYSEAIDELAHDPGRMPDVLRARDAVAASAPDRALLSELDRLDERLRALLVSSNASPAAGEPSSRREAPAPQPSTWWTVGAVLLLAVAVSLGAEVAGRFLAGGPDFLGIFSTLLQVLVLMLAGSALTQAGGQTIDGLLGRLGVRSGDRPKWKAGMAALLLSASLAFRLSLPGIARLYNDRGVRLQAGGRPSSAIAAFKRAASLSPDYGLAHYNLASAYEDILLSELAETEYRLAIQSDPELYVAYNNLARLYLKDGRDAGSALQLTEQGLALDPTEPEVLYSLHKNGGWARLELGLFGQAERELRRAVAARPDGAAAWCLLALGAEKRGEAASALESWQRCLAHAVPGEAVEDAWVFTALERLGQ
jgi:tetratricopeptide (TPR) repeat protein